MAELGCTGRPEQQVTLMVQGATKPRLPVCVRLTMGRTQQPPWRPETSTAALPSTGRLVTPMVVVPL